MIDPQTNLPITQTFGANHDIYAPLDGHPAYDEHDPAHGYGSIIKPLATGILYSEYSPENPASDGYTAVYTLCRTPLEWFEMSYGHVSEIMSKIGDTVVRGVTDMAREGNHGMVYDHGVLITLAMQKAGDHRGSHRHYQKRPVLRKPKVSGHFLQTRDGIYRDSEGMYYEVVDYENGFNGCVDWMEPMFNYDLEYGDQDYRVLLLQRALVLEGFGSFEPTGYFGMQTKAAVRSFQAAHGLDIVGRCGPATRAILNGRYKQLA